MASGFVYYLDINSLKKGDWTDIFLQKTMTLFMRPFEKNPGGMERLRLFMAEKLGPYKWEKEREYSDYLDGLVSGKICFGSEHEELIAQEWAKIDAKPKSRLEVNPEFQEFDDMISRQFDQETVYGEALYAYLNRG